MPFVLHTFYNLSSLHVAFLYLRVCETLSKVLGTYGKYSCKVSYDIYTQIKCIIHLIKFYQNTSCIRGK
jgi:hypothetical protein